MGGSCRANQPARPPLTFPLKDPPGAHLSHAESLLLDPLEVQPGFVGELLNVLPRHTPKMSTAPLEDSSFLGLEGLHVFVTGAAGESPQFN